MGDIGPIRVAPFKRDRHLGTIKQRPVKTVGVTRIGTSQTHPQAFSPFRPFRPVKIKRHPVQPVFINIPVRVVHDRAAYPGGQGARYPGFGDQFRSKTDVFRVGDRGECHFKTAIPARTAANTGYHRPFTKGFRGLPPDFQLLTRQQRGGCRQPPQLSLSIQVTFMLQPGVEHPA
ncbi:hypothetical protein O185_25810, partial [Photorhabdus temperata J3]